MIPSLKVSQFFYARKIVSKPFVAQTYCKKILNLFQNRHEDLLLDVEEKIAVIVSTIKPLIGISYAIFFSLKNLCSHVKKHLTQILMVEFQRKKVYL